MPISRARRPSVSRCTSFERVLVSDPPKGLHIPLAQLAAEADVITFHTPLTRAGAFLTYHLCDAEFLVHCRPGTLIINAARGGVVDEEVVDEGGNLLLVCQG